MNLGLMPEQGLVKSWVVVVRVSSCAYGSVTAILLD